ncbi:TIGR03084 family metal-binding protein [Sciscionella marina]|uniref:TIGR03084 family metal-binding protein n=1 Tax=Sciscionella marina TaxID=508770 RepID=UPI00037AD9CD|nr:TIGR03084 family metal-binding protein [Sciscionella marina]
MPVFFAELLGDLEAETTVLDVILADLPRPSWERPTPAEGWAIRDQVSHLAYFDEAATEAAQDPQAFREHAAELTALGPTFPDTVAQRYRNLSPDRLLDWFRTARRRLIDTFATLEPRTRAPWYGPDMSVASSVTARLMETWAHGQDIVDAAGVFREPTARLRHIAHLAMSTFAFSHQLHNLPVPDTAVYVELDAPDGDTWIWGEPSALDRVAGPALDFCLAVTQRRHTADTALRIEGPVATKWMSIAQTFAGAPGTGRQPGQFAQVSTGKETRR